MAKPDEKLLAAMSACVAHARDLVESAKAVQALKRDNIAYHLATLALEELGKRELYAIQNAAKAVGDPPTWQTNATQDHVKKLFWCFFGMRSVQHVADQDEFLKMREAVADIHAIRMQGLYVERDDTGLSVPSNAISPKQTQSLIELATSFVEYAESAKPRDDIPQEDIDLQLWFLTACDELETRPYIFNAEALAELRRLGDVVAWARYIKGKIEADQARLLALTEKEIRRTPDSLGTGSKDRWRIQFKLHTTSNSVRPNPLKKWNARVDWIKLFPQQGAKKKEELLVELVLGDNVPVYGLQGFGFTLALRFIIAINMATSGFWWWPPAPNQRRFYSRIRDLETNHEVTLEDQSFHIFNKRAELTDGHMHHLSTCLVALPDPADPHKGQAYTHYLGGLTFISLNCIQWRCEALAYGNFLQSMKLLIVQAEYATKSETADAAIGRFLTEKYPGLNSSDHAAFLNLIKDFEQHAKPVKVTLADVFLMKCLCETIFRDNIAPAILDQIRGAATRDAVSDPRSDVE
jgi:AbiV family abortive infection protein